METKINELKESENRLNFYDFKKEIIIICENICTILKIQKFKIYSNIEYESIIIYWDNIEKKIKTFTFDKEDESNYFSEKLTFWELVEKFPKQSRTEYITKNTAKRFIELILKYVEEKSQKNNELINLFLQT